MRADAARLELIAQARRIGKILNEEERELLLAAAYLHDIGYAPELRKTGFHPLDGASYIRSCGHERLAYLVAHHFAARFEAQLRGCEPLLNTFLRERSPLFDALEYCDCTTGPTGEHISLKQRAAEIRSRYQEGDAVVQALNL
jgi:hypothetical protein